MAEQQFLDADSIERLRQMAREDLFFFAKGILGYSKLNARIHGPLCKLLMDHTKNRKLVVLPRSWYKTTVCSVAYPIWRALRNRNVRILLVQNTYSNAVSKLKSIKDQWEGNELLRALFPELLPKVNSVWKADSLCLSRQKAYNESTFEAAGIRTQVTGRHYDLIIQDDTCCPDLDNMTDSAVTPTKEDVDKAIGYHRAISPLLNDYQDELLVVGTRWFERDVISEIRATQNEFFVYERAVRETAGKADPKGVITYPERFDEKVLAGLERDMGPYLYSCLYLNAPLRSSDMLFRAEWFKYYANVPKSLMVYTTIDPAGDPGESKGRNDYNVVCTTGKDMESGVAYVLRIDRGKWSPGKLIDTVFEHVEQFSPLRVGVESVAYQGTLSYWIKERQRKVNKFFFVEKINPGRRSKNARIMGLQPVIANSGILFRPTDGWLVTELLAFPLGAHDDGADALAMHLDLWKTTPGAKTKDDTQRRLSIAWTLDEVIKDIEERDRVIDGSVYDVIRESNHSEAEVI